MHRERDNGVAFVSGYDSPSTGSADEIFDPTEIDGTCATTQDQADVWMGDQVTGIERVFVSRLHLNRTGRGVDMSADPAVIGARANKVWYGPVQYQHGSEPYMRIAVAGNLPAAGIAVADVNLKTARLLGVELDTSAILFRANKVIA